MPEYLSSIRKLVQSGQDEGMAWLPSSQEAPAEVSWCQGVIKLFCVIWGLASGMNAMFPEYTLTIVLAGTAFPWRSLRDSRAATNSRKCLLKKSWCSGVLENNFLMVHCSPSHSRHLWENPGPRKRHILKRLGRSKAVWDQKGPWMPGYLDTDLRVGAC